ncbi:MAG: zinc ribbon domain-containing protein [Candidatus Kariarchaeaceae archaeon]
MGRKAERKKIRDTKKAEKKAREKERRQEKINSFIETYNKMSVAEQILGSIAVAFIILSLITIGSFVIIITGSVAIILIIVAVTLYQGRQRRNKRLLKFIEIQKEIDLKSIKELLGWSEKSTLSAYIDIVSSGNRNLFYNLETKKLHWVGQTRKGSDTQPVESGSIPQEKVFCTYCGNENESNTTYCVSCGDPII